jgi:hypothetical protein
MNNAEAQGFYQKTQKKMGTELTPQFFLEVYDPKAFFAPQNAQICS